MSEQEQQQEKTMSLAEFQGFLASQGNSQFGQLLDQSIFHKNGSFSIEHSHIEAALDKAKQTMATYKEAASQNESLGQYYSAIMQQIEKSLNLLKQNSK